MPEIIRKLKNPSVHKIIETLKRHNFHPQSSSSIQMHPQLILTNALVATVAAAKTYGTAQIKLYHDSNSCHGSVTTRTLPGPVEKKYKQTNSKCYVSSQAVMSIELHDAPPRMGEDCTFAWYADESCNGGDYDAAYADAGVCFNTTITEPGYVFQTHSYRLYCN